MDNKGKSNKISRLWISRISTPWGIYSKLSNDNKIQFWAITSSCFVCVFTFFIGLAYQYLVIDETKEENRRIMHTQYVDNVKPILMQHRNVINFTDKCSREVQTIQNNIERYLKDENNENQFFVRNKDAELDSLLASINEFADSVYDFSKSFYNAVDIPKYYLYDNYRDSITIIQDSLENNLFVYEVIDYIMRARSQNKIITKNDIEKLVLVPAGYDEDFGALIMMANLNRPIDNITKKVNLITDIYKQIDKIEDYFFRNAMPTFVQSPPDQGKKNVLKVGGILLIVGCIIWVAILNVSFIRKHNPSNPKSNSDTNKCVDAINEIVSKYNNDENIKDDEYVADPLTIYDRLYSQWKEMKIELDKMKNKKNIVPDSKNV